MDPSVVDVVVVGAGMAGIAAARFYLEVHPECRLVMLERDSCAGGVWNSRRIYDGFWTQWTVGLGEWSDMRMPRPPDEDLYINFFKAEHTTAYLETYIRERRFAGRSLYQRMKFEYKVKKIKKKGTQWIVTGGDGAEVFYSAKIIIASGTTSVPNMPILPGRINFEAPIIHQEGFGQSSIISAKEMHNVTVVGGGKSSADMVYTCVKAGKSVTWIVGRNGGSGPGFLLSPKGKGPYEDAFAIGSTGIASTLSPSILLPDTWWTRLLHQTSFGQKIVKAIWAGVDKETRKEADFHGRQDALQGFEHLDPHTPLFWQNGTGGLLHKEDFWDVIASSVQIYLDDILEVDKKLIRLVQGPEIPTDVLLCGTGWDKTSFDFFEPEEAVRLGVPHPLKDQGARESTKWAQLEAQADRDIVAKFPILANPPEHPHKVPKTTPYRLHKGIAPLHDNTVAFVGFAIIANYFRGVECQAIWATAFLDGKVTLPAIESQEADIARINAWCKRRYLSNGELGNFFPFESNLYLDELLQDVGLKSHLKGWFDYYFTPGKAHDLAGLKDEYIAKYGGGDSSTPNKMEVARATQ